MYKLGESLRLKDLKDLGFNPKTILDIGAHKGQFYGWAKLVWPESFIWMVEANTCHARTLEDIIQNTNDQYTISTLGDSEREVTFYTRSDKPHTEGASYYREKAFGNLAMEIPKKLECLDKLFSDDSEFELIKLDTQGSELDILRGGSQICKKAKYIILEIALITLNDGAPTKEEIISYMESYGFSPSLNIGDHYFPSVAAADEAGVDITTIIQQDIAFKNKVI